MATKKKTPAVTKSTGQIGPRGAAIADAWKLARDKGGPPLLNRTTLGKLTNGDLALAILNLAAWQDQLEESVDILMETSALVDISVRAASIESQTLSEIVKQIAHDLEEVRKKADLPGVSADALADLTKLTTKFSKEYQELFQRMANLPHAEEAKQDPRLQAAIAALPESLRDAVSGYYKSGKPATDSRTPAPLDRETVLFKLDNVR